LDETVLREALQSWHILLATAMERPFNHNEAQLLGCPDNG
jgi:hypothetical protein